MKLDKLPLTNDYQVMTCDPPWEYKDKGKSGKRGARQQYKTMSLAEMAALPIEFVISKDSVLFMWFTDTHYNEAVALCRAWGFEPKRIGFVWVKVTKDFTQQRIMLGRYTRSNAEFVLIATHGKGLKRKRHDIRQIVFSVPSDHSKKPNEVKKRITALYGQRKSIELFARNVKDLNDGWDYFGDQV